MPSWLSIPLEHEDRVAEAFAHVFGYEEEVPGEVSGEEPGSALVPNPESKIDFAKRHLKRYVKTLVVNQEVKAASSAAASTAAAKADTELPL